MKKQTKWFLAPYTASLLLLVQPTSTPAEVVYQKIHEDGSIEFSDVPDQENTTAIEIDPAPAFNFPTPPSPTYKASAQPPDQTHLKYNSLTITSPNNEAVMHENGGNLTVTVAIQPQLQKGHLVVLSDNGKRTTAPQEGVSFSLTNLNRGKHVFTVTVLDATGNTLISSPPVAIQLMRASVLSPARQNGAPNKVGNPSRSFKSLLPGSR